MKLKIIKENFDRAMQEVSIEEGAEETLSKVGGMVGKGVDYYLSLWASIPKAAKMAIINSPGIKKLIDDSYRAGAEAERKRWLQYVKAKEAQAADPDVRYPTSQQVVD
jgi:hypothetical protein